MWQRYMSYVINVELPPIQMWCSRVLFSHSAVYKNNTCVVQGTCTAAITEAAIQTPDLEPSDTSHNIITLVSQFLIK